MGVVDGRAVVATSNIQVLRFQNYFSSSAGLVAQRVSFATLLCPAEIKDFLVSKVSLTMRRGDTAVAAFPRAIKMR
jgi:hypothetical protein